jgi:hypothetical protein
MSGTEKKTTDEIVLDSSYDVLVLLFDHELLFVIVDWLGTVLEKSVRTNFRDGQVKDQAYLTAILQTLFHGSKESRVTMQPSSFILGVESG